MNGPDALCLERGFKIQVEIGCIHADKNIGALLQQADLQLIAYADNFPVVRSTST